MINKYDYGLAGSVETRAPFLRDHGPDAADNPIVFAGGARAASEFTIRARAPRRSRRGVRVDGVMAEFTIRRSIETRSTRPRGPRATRDASTRPRPHETVPHAHAVAAESTRRRVAAMAYGDASPREHTPSPRKNTGGFLSLTGYKLEQVLGRNCRFLQGPRTDARAVAKIETPSRAGRDVQIVLLNYKIDSTTFWNHFFIAALRDDKGDVVNFLGVQIEVSERVAVGILQNAEGKAKQPEKGPAVQAAAAAAAAQLPPKSSGTKRERGA